jgi:glycosyltransferase involved in cell wall biosynthesis
MRIAIDGRELHGQPTGVGRYLAHLLDAWESLPEARGHEFVRYAPDGSGGTRWEQLSLPLALHRGRPDVLFAPAYTAPLLTKVPVALTIHDLSFVAHPEWFPAKSGFRRRVVSRLAARRARVVITDAEFSRGEIVRRLGVPASKVRVIPLGLTRPKTAPLEPRPAVSGASAGRDAPAVRSTVLFVGSIFNRRHPAELVQAFASVRARHPELRLEIVGDNRTYPHVDLQAVVAAAGVEAATSIHSYVADGALADLYRRAGAFVFLSDYEGFGLTPLEAMQAGVPVLAGDTPVAREVYGDAAAYVDTRDVGAIAEHLERLLFDPGTRRVFLRNAPPILARYSWERTARETLSALIEAAHG